MRDSANRCQCELCIRGREFRVRLDLIAPDQKAYFEEMYNDLQNIDNDLDYHRAILSGAWPNSVSILEQALEKARLIEATRKDNQ